MRLILSAINASGTDIVKLKATKLTSHGKDMLTILQFSDLIQPAENFTIFFTRPESKILNYRNVHFVKIRNHGDSDQHTSYDMDDISADVMRYKDANKITMANIGGHCFGAKLTFATANSNLKRFTGVITFDGGPIDHKYYEAWYKLKELINFSHNMKLYEMEPATAIRAI